MLEQRIEELTAAVKTLTEIMKVQYAMTSDPGHSHRILDFGPKSVVVSVSDKTPNEKPKSEDTTNTSQTSSPELPAATYEDVKRATNAVSKISREKAIAGLARFGVQIATKLAETQWAEYVAYMGKVAAGELDPEDSHE